MSFEPEVVRGSVVPIVLALLAERAMYGYEMVKLVNARSNGLLEWKEGTLYPVLHKLESDGLIESDWRSVVTQGGEPGERKRKYYAITRSGRTEMKRRLAEWKLFQGTFERVVNGGVA